MATSKVIITGGLGYIGSHTAVELIQKGYETILFDNLSNSQIEVLEGIEEITGVKPTFKEVDVSDQEQCLKAFSKFPNIDGVIHFAALKAVGESVENPKLYYKNNVLGLLYVLEAMEKYNIPNHIFSSSCTVYGEPDNLPVTEQSALKPAESPYGATKQIGEELLRVEVTSRKEALKAIALRYFNPIGAHASYKIGELPLGIPNNLMPFITQTAIGIRKILKVYGNDYDTADGTAIRDYIHVVDLAQAHVLALERLTQGRNEENFEVFNLGTGKGSSVLDVIRSFEKVSGEKLNYEIAARRAGDVIAVFADPSLANQKLQWKTKLDLDEMTLSAWNWEKAYRAKENSQ